MKIIDNSVIDYQEQGYGFFVGVFEEELSRVIYKPEEVKDWRLVGLKERIFQLKEEIDKIETKEELKKLREKIEYDYIYKAVYTKYILDKGKYQ
ncbi:MAG: hypothetical protein QXS29_10785 [Nitrososphaeria archaeon]